MIFIKRFTSAILATVMVLGMVLSSAAFVFAKESETLKIWNVAEISELPEEADGGVVVNETKDIVFTAPVRGVYALLPANIGESANSLKSISGDWEVSFIAKDKSFGTPVLVSNGAEAAIPMSEETLLNKGEEIVVSLTPSASGSIHINYDIILFDELPALVPAKTNFVIADELQVSNITAETPAYSGIFSVGCASSCGLTGSDLTYERTAFYVAASGYTHYNGTSNNHVNYNLRAMPSDYVNAGNDNSNYVAKMVAIHTKYNSMQGVVVTADRNGTYTISSSKVLKGGGGAINFKIEGPDGSVLYSITGNDDDGFSVTVSLEKGEKLYLYADRTNPTSYSLADIYISDLSLSIDSDEVLYEEDPNYDYVYEDHSNADNHAASLAASASYTVKDGVLTVKFPERDKDNTLNYNWETWAYIDGVWTKMLAIDNLTHKIEYSGSLADCEVYILCKDDAGFTLFNDYTKGGAQNLWIDDIIDDATDYDYSFAIVGDTQMITRDDVNAGKNNLGAIYDWLVANAESNKIKYVFGVGDITETREGLDTEWGHAKEQIEKLNGVIPYGLAQGNHDNATAMNNYFGGDNYYAQSLDGVYQEGDITASYQKIDVGSEKYLMITLHWGPRDAELNWASEIIKANPDRKVIINTHAFLETDGTTQGPDDSTPANSSGANMATSANNGDRIWEKLASQHENVVLVVSGHIPTDNIVYRQEKGVHGNVVTSLLVDQQTFDQKNGYNTGMVAMLYFSNDGKDVRVEYISTCRNKFYGASNQFDLHVGDPVFKTWNIGETFTSKNAYSFTAPVNGVYNLLPADLEVSGEWAVVLYKGGEELASATISAENTALPFDKYIELNKDETLSVACTPISDGEITADYTVELVDEIAPKVSASGEFKEVISVADYLQLTNTTNAMAPTTGLITVGYAEGSGKTGKDLTFGNRNSRLFPDEGFSVYFGNYNSDIYYTVKAIPSTYTRRSETDAYAANTLSICSKSGAAHGIVITADRDGVYTLSSSAVYKDGLGAMNLIIEGPDGKINYLTSYSPKGLEISVHLEVGEKLYLYADRTSDDYRTAEFILYDLFLTRVCDGESLVDDPDYVYKYETHSTAAARWETVRKENCIIKGLEIRRCTICHEEVDFREKAAYGDHNYTHSTWEILSLPDWQNKGSQEMHCCVSGCEEVKSEILSIPAVTEVKVTADPTDTVYEIGEEFNPEGLALELSYEGYDHKTVITDFENVQFTYEFARVGVTTVTVEVAGLQASLSVNVISNGENSTGIKGDSNADGWVTNEDAIAILQFIAGYDSPAFQYVDADVNGDSIVDVGDAVLIMQYIAGYKVSYIE